MKKIYKSVATVGLFGLLTRGVGFLFKVYLSRKIGAKALGSFQIAESVFFTLVTVCASGIPLALSRSVAEAENVRSRDGAFSSAMAISLPLACAVVLLVFIFKRSLTRIVPDEESATLLLILAPAVISSTVYSVTRGWFWGQKKFAVYSGIELTEGVTRAVIGVLLIGTFQWSRNDSYGAAIAFLISDFLSAALIVIAFFKHGGRLLRPLNAKNILSKSAPVTAVRLVSSVVSSAVSVIIPAVLTASGMTQNEALAEFGRASGMAIPVIFAPAGIIGSISVVTVPDNASDGAKKQFKKLNGRLTRVLNFSTFISLLFVAIYLPLGKNIGVIIFNDEKAGEYISLACFLLLFTNWNGIATSTLNALGLGAKNLLHYAIGAGIMLAFVLIFPQYIGIYAMAVGSGICFAITATLNFLTIKKKTGLKFSFLKTGVTSGVFALTSALAGFFANNVIPLPLLPKTLICVAIVAFFYLSLNAVTDNEIFKQLRFSHSLKATSSSS